MENVGKWALAVGSWMLSYFFGGWSGVLGVLLVFVMLFERTNTKNNDDKCNSAVSLCDSGFEFHCVLSETNAIIMTTM